jgi:type I restriction enzyme R subunit
VFFGEATADRLRLSDLKDLAARIARPPVSATAEELWRCYEALDAAKVRGHGGTIDADLVSLIRHTLHPDEELRPFPEVARERYAAWRQQQAAAGVLFTDEQGRWLDKIAEHIAVSVSIDRDDLQEGWFAQRGSLGKAYELFGDRLWAIVDELNKRLAV